MRRWRFSRLVACGVAFYVLLVALASFIGRSYALGKADDLLKFATADIQETVGDWLISNMLSYAAYSLEEELGTASAYSKDKLGEYLRIFNVDERTIGGLGILMVKKLMDDVSYVHDQGRNVLRFRKQF